jgi:hypothetical protein
MSTPRKLTAERIAFIFSGRILASEKEALLAHLAAVEQEHAAEVERLTREREGMRSDAVGALKGIVDLLEILGPREKEPAADTARRIVAERDALRAEVEALKADTAARRLVAAQMANVLFNVSQQPWVPEDVRVSMERVRKEWDALGPHPGAALLEEHRKALEPLQAVVTGLAQEMEAAIRERERPKGGMSVPFHGDFCNAPPSMLGRLRWWARELREALAGRTSALLVRARNEGLEKARLKASVKKAVALEFGHKDRAATLLGLEEEIEALKEPES